MKNVKWTDLIVTAASGESLGTLQEVLENSPRSLDYAKINDGKIVEFGCHFLSAPDEEPDWDTPRGLIDWTGFGEVWKCCASIVVS